MQILLITGFGVAGICLRYTIAYLFNLFLTESFPYGTLAINISGSFLIGIVYVLGAERGAISPELRVALMTGLIGSYTTFSAVSLEGMQLIEHGRIGMALCYVMVSSLLGVASAGAGLELTRFLIARL